MAKANSYTGLVLLAFSAYYLLEALRLPFWSSVGPGAGALPVASGLTFAVLAVTLVAKSWRSQSGEEAPDFSRWKIPTMILVALFFAVLLAKTLGMLIILFLFTLFHTIIVEKVPWKKGLLASAGLATVFYLVFEVWLGVPMIMGVFGI